MQQAIKSMEKVQELHDLSVDTLKDVLNDKEVSLTKIKVALTSFSSSTREMATWRASDAVQLSIIRELSSNKDELAEYIKTTMPDYCPIKKIN